MSVAKSKYAGYPHYSFVQSFEEGVTPEGVIRWFRNYWHFSIYISVVYLILIFVLREYMKGREPVNVRRAVIVWDASLAAFCICGMLRIVPEVLFVLRNYGMEFSVCDSTANSVSLFWGAAFVFSKVPELLDTVFIVLKKQKLTVLHVSHHVLTLIILFRDAKEIPAAARFLVVTNYSVHSFMYSYFALKAARFNIPIGFSMIMTTAQILQMCLYIFVCAYVLRAKMLGHECTTGVWTGIIGLVFSTYLLYMFVDFFIHRYNSKNKNTDGKIAS